MDSRSSSPPRLAVLLSGGGRTLLNLQDRIDDGSLCATIPLVIASRPGPGADRAAARGLNVRILPGRIPKGTLAALFREFTIDYAALAGYLHLIEIPPGYEGRIVNIHPALLPRHGGKGMHGTHVHQAVLRAGDTESGCTVHLVDDRYDTGPALLQLRCPVLPTDTPETLAARVFDLECRAYPEALKLLFGRAQASSETKRLQ